MASLERPHGNTVTWREARSWSMAIANIHRGDLGQINQLPRASASLTCRKGKTTGKIFYIRGPHHKSYEKSIKYFKASKNTGPGTIIMHSCLPSQTVIPRTPHHNGWYASGNLLISQPSISTFTSPRAMLNSTAQSQPVTVKEPLNPTGSNHTYWLTVATPWWPK